MKTFYCGAFDEGDKSAPTEDVFPAISACKYTSQENKSFPPASTRHKKTMKCRNFKDGGRNDGKFKKLACVIVRQKRHKAINKKIPCSLQPHDRAAR